MDGDEGAFDIVVVGTGLTESIAAAALAKAGFKVAHLDENPHYGAAEASLSFEELVAWQSNPRPGFSNFSRSGDTISQPRAYSLSLSPALIPSTGPLIDALVASGVSRYGGFRLLERVCIYHPSGIAKPVPGSKEDVFKSKEISLVEKRRLMRFLQFAAGEFEDNKELESHADSPFPEYLRTECSLNEEMTSAIAYALAYCLSPSDPTLPALHRLRRYLRSSGRYGASPFLVGHYGSSGEIAQGFCRTAAVSGGIYILGRRIESVDSSNEATHTIRIEEFPDPITCSLLISGSAPGASVVPPPAEPSAPFSTSSPTYTVARCIAIVDGPILFNAPPMEDAAEEATPEATPSDTGVIVFPPSSLPNGGSITAAATVLITGEGTMSCPKGKWILYISLPLIHTTESDPQTLLKPYLDATLALAVPPLQPLFSTYYLQHPTRPAEDSGIATTAPALAPTPLPPVLPLPDAGDAAAVHAEGMFWAVVRRLGQEDEISSFWPAMEERDQDVDD
ncbi:GDP dissociation inhibitor-domain-containing protein [Mycena amicta]|nr:GDP dissociation inhibitor-domain-containing protein [Mycena amicta]